MILDGCNKPIEEICYKYQKKDSRIIIFKQENKGEGASRNKAIELASGKWITFVDADDWIDEGYLQNVYEKILKEENNDIFIFDCYVEYRNKQIKNAFYTKSGTLNKEDIEEIELQNIGKGETKYFPNHCNISVVWAKAYKKEFIKENNLTFVEKIKRTPDALFNMFAFERAKCISHYSIYGYHYRINENSITQNYDKNIISDINVFLKNVDNYIKEFNKNKRFRNTYYITILNKLIQIYEIYISNKKINELKEFIDSQQYKNYTEEIKNIPKYKLNLYQRFMLNSIINRNVFFKKLLIKIKLEIKKFQNKRI